MNLPEVGQRVKYRLDYVYDRWMSWVGQPPDPDVYWLLILRDAAMVGTYRGHVETQSGVRAIVEWDGETALHIRPLISALMKAEAPRDEPNAEAFHRFKREREK